MVSGSRIKHFRLEKNMTQEQLAEASELSSNYISQIENNKKQVSMTALRRMAEVLNVPVSRCLEESNQTASNPNTKIVVDELLDCTNYELIIIRDMVRQLKKSLRAN
jgi:transcriptional regulator with XRE-family HTH domain